ncbi:response regulator transcription factor [Streptomyces sp. NPDC000658]|nr:response regulator transcription factor [Streptomyces griseorubiginosus]
MSESTVKFHVAKILDKLGVSPRGGAAALAHEWGES